MLTMFLETIKNTFPELLQKQKIHLLLHLVDDIENLGPAMQWILYRKVSQSTRWLAATYDAGSIACAQISNYCVCLVIILSRFEAFNSVIRGMNVHSNRHASSLDICTKIAKMERLRFVLSGGKWGEIIMGN